MMPNHSWALRDHFDKVFGQLPGWLREFPQRIDETLDCVDAALAAWRQAAGGDMATFPKKAEALHLLAGKLMMRVLKESIPMNFLQFQRLRASFESAVSDGGRRPGAPAYQLGVDGQGRARIGAATSTPTEPPWFETLMVWPDAPAADIKRAYKLRALELHPDRNGNSPEANEDFKRLGQAKQAAQAQRSDLRF
jgi:hypothetical protein